MASSVSIIVVVCANTLHVAQLLSVLLESPFACLLDAGRFATTVLCFSLISKPCRWRILRIRT